jgi:hypothetical protein
MRQEGKRRIERFAQVVLSRAGDYLKTRFSRLLKDCFTERRFGLRHVVAGFSSRSTRWKVTRAKAPDYERVDLYSRRFWRVFARMPCSQLGKNAFNDHRLGHILTRTIMRRSGILFVEAETVRIEAEQTM